MLKDVAYHLRKHLRALDHVYRIGGEEFVAVLPGADLAHAGEAAERLRAAIEAARPGGLPVSISFGVVAASGDECSDFACMYSTADAALYEAKQAGRNTIRLANGMLPERRTEPAVVPA